MKDDHNLKVRSYDELKTFVENKKKIVEDSKASDSDQGEALVFLSKALEKIECLETLFVERKSRLFTKYQIKELAIINGKLGEIDAKLAQSTPEYSKASEELYCFIIKIINEFSAAIEYSKIGEKEGRKLIDGELASWILNILCAVFGILSPLLIKWIFPLFGYDSTAGTDEFFYLLEGLVQAGLVLITLVIWVIWNKHMKKKRGYYQFKKMLAGFNEEELGVARLESCKKIFIKENRSFTCGCFNKTSQH